MYAISQCESGLNQFEPDGTVLISRLGTDDRGLFQINYPIWGSLSQELGIDLHTQEGNMQMAKVILKRQGLNAWYLSYNCWSRLLN